MLGQGQLRRQQDQDLQVNRPCTTTVCYAVWYMSTCLVDVHDMGDTHQKKVSTWRHCTAGSAARSSSPTQKQAQRDQPTAGAATAAPTTVSAQGSIVTLATSINALIHAAKQEVETTAKLHYSSKVSSVKLVAMETD